MERLGLGADALSGVPPPPPGFTIDAASSPRQPQPRGSSIPPPPDGFTLDGSAHDGDTFGLEGGGSLRLYGADAPELKQQGFRRDMTPVPLGELARSFALPMLPGATVGPVVGESYNRPVAPVDSSGRDVGETMIRAGDALAAPDYLKRDPIRLGKYMDAERLARQNRLGMHGVYATSPKQFRLDPDWQPDQQTVAQFFDSPTPFAGLRPDIAKGYIEIAHNGTAADIIAYARANGFQIDEGEVPKFVAERDKGATVANHIPYRKPPPVLTNQGDGATGAAMRGVGDGVLPNLLDEFGAVPDSLGLTPGRENVFNSDRRVADILANNVDQNRAIIGYDKMAHPYARLGGELAGGLVLPFGSGARTVPELAKVGAAYGAIAGFGGGDTLPERLTGAALNAGAGAVVTAGGGKLLQSAEKLGRRMFGRTGEAIAQGTGEVGEGYADNSASDALTDAARDVDGVGIGSGSPRASVASDGQIPPPPAGYRLDAQAMDAESMPSPTALARLPDYLDTGPVQPRPLLREPTEAERAAQTAGIEPRDVLPIPSNEVGSVEEAAAKDAGRIVEATAPNERTALTGRTVRNWRGEPVPKVGPIDLVGFLRLRGGLQDQGGELAHMGLNNAVRRGMDHVGQETRFGPLVNPEGSTLDDAAFAAWEAGYFPELHDRPDLNTFLDALRDTHEGRERRFLPEDHAELDAHEAMRAERYDLEQRRAEVGGPVFTDRSVPAGPDQPFAPPEAYEEWPADAVKRAGNINLDKLDSPQDISRALHTVDARVGFDAATRGRITQAETERLASELGMTPDTLMARRKGQALNAEEALAARQILAKSGNELVNAAKRIQGLENPGDELLAEFQRKIVRHAAIQEQVAGATAEAGRALQQFRMLADSRTVRGDVLAAMVNGGGGAKRLKEAADVLLDAAETSPGVFNTVAEKALKPKWHDKIAEWYVNALLGWPQTHVVNVTSNTLTSLAQIPEFALGAAIGGARQLAKRDPVDRITGSEVGARAFGLLQGAKEGARLFAQALRTGEGSDFGSKVEGQQFKAIDGKLGEVVRIPTRFLTAEDELFKGVARRMELNGQAVRIARKEGLRGDTAKARIAELVANPTDEMFQRALDYGRYLTFQQKLGPFAQKVSAISNENLVVKSLLPFVRTPTNLLKFAVERSPAAPLLKEWRKDFIAGGERRDLAVARAMIGTGFGLAMYQAANAGTITGSAPSDPKKARLLYADGWKPYSVKIDGTYYSYKRLDPFSTTIGVAADLATLPGGMTEKQRQDKSTLLIASIMGNLASKTWLSGASSFVEAISEPERYAGDFKNRLIASFLLPNVVGGTARAIDPVARQADSLGEEMQSRVPGMRDDLLPRRDVWGRAIKSEGGLGPDAFSPIWVSKALDDPVNHELMQLDYAPGYPAKKVGGRDLTPEEFDRYVEMAGNRSHDSLAKLVTGEAWRRMDDDAKVKAARDVVGRARETARAVLFGTRAAKSSAPSQSIEAPPPGFTVEGESGGVNVYSDIQKAIPGVRFTSGYRTAAYQANMRRRGYHPDPNSAHLDGSKLDLLPPPGQSMGWLKREVRRFRPDAVLNDEGDHLDVRFPGYYGAPAIGGAKAAGLRNPLEGMPPPPAGFKLDAR